MLEVKILIAEAYAAGNWVVIPVGHKDFDGVSKPSVKFRTVAWPVMGADAEGFRKACGDLQVLALMNKDANFYIPDLEQHLPDLTEWKEILAAELKEDWFRLCQK